MKKFTLSLIWVIVVTIAFTSCTIEKRVYLPGYHVQKTGKIENKKEIRTNESETKVAEIKLKETSPLETLTQESASIQEVETYISEENNLVASNDLNAVFSQLSKKESKVLISNFISSNNNLNSDNQETKEATTILADKEAKQTKRAGGKSQVIALILVLVAGTLGVHRMYLGYWGIGIIQLLTFGGCGIWTLIDLIRIITGDLKPKTGRYTTKL